MPEIYLDETMKCKIHPKYQAVRNPKRTGKFPNGCPECKEIFARVQAMNDYDNDPGINAEIKRAVEEDNS
jgi:hypothetical protein